MDADKLECVKVVTQRMVSSKLLLNAADDVWASTKQGLVFHVSFTKSCPSDKDLKPICKSLLTSSLSTTPSAGGWQQDHSDADSVINICKKGEEQWIVIIPQASLTTKLIPGEKYLKYHNQCEKSTAEVLYNKFQTDMKIVIKELLGKKDSSSANAKKVNVSGWKERQKQVVLLTVPPEKYFIDSVEDEFKDAFGSFNDDGFPLTDKEGVELAKSRKKKLEKMIGRYSEKWKKQQANAGRDGGSGKVEAAKEEAANEEIAAKHEVKMEVGKDAAADAKDAVAEATDDVKDFSAQEEVNETKIETVDLSALVLEDEKFVVPQIVAGTFGGRQGFEMVSSGPFTHSFAF